MSFENNLSKNLGNEMTDHIPSVCEHLILRYSVASLYMVMLG